MFESNSLKRYIICFKKTEFNSETLKDELIKKIKIVKHYNQADAEIKLCNNEGIPRQIITRDSEKEGMIYCNRVYNPRFDDEFKLETLEPDEEPISDNNS